MWESNLLLCNIVCILLSILIIEVIPRDTFNNFSNSMTTITSIDNDNVFRDLGTLFRNFNKTSKRTSSVATTSKKVIKKSKSAKAVKQIQKPIDTDLKRFIFIIPILKSFLSIKFFFQKGFYLYSTSATLSKRLSEYIKKDYEVFITKSDREKEDIIIIWTDLAKQIEDKYKKSDWLPLTLRPTFVKLEQIISKVHAYISKLDNELYGKREYSQDQLKELASKISHLPTDMLQDLISDDY